MSFLRSGAGQMKILVLGSRILLGMLFTAIGLNHLVKFTHMAVPPGDPATLLGLMVAHHWFVFYGLLIAEGDTGSGLAEEADGGGADAARASGDEGGAAGERESYAGGGGADALDMASILHRAGISVIR